MFHKEDGRRLKSFKLNLFPHTQRCTAVAALAVLRWLMLALNSLIVLEVEGGVLFIFFRSYLMIIFVLGLVKVHFLCCLILYIQ